MNGQNTMIPAKNARALVTSGKAKCESLVYSRRGDGSEATYMAITNYEAQRTQHYLVGEGRIAPDQLPAADRAIYSA